MAELANTVLLSSGAELPVLESPGEILGRLMAAEDHPEAWVELTRVDGRPVTLRCGAILGFTAAK